MEPEIVEVKVRQRPIYRQDLHLASALVYSEIEFLWRFRHMQSLWFSHLDMIQRCGAVPPRWIRDPEHTVTAPRLLQLFNDRCLPEKGDADKLRKQLEVALLAWKWGRTAVLQGNDPRDMASIRRQIMTLASDPTLLKLLTVRCQIRSILKQASRTSDSLTITRCGLQFYFSGNLFFWTDTDGPNVDPWSAFCSLNDLASGRFTTVLYSLIADIIDSHPAGARTPHVLTLLKYMDAAVQKHGQKAYTIFKVMPSLVIGHFLQCEEPEGGVVFFSALIADLKADNLSDDDVVTFLTSYDTKTETHLFLELAGLWKCAGHPVIDVEAGIKKVHDRGGYITPGVFDAAQQIANEFKYQFTLEFWQKHHKWPKMTICEGASTVLRTAHATGTWPSGRIKPKDFRNVKFQKVFEFDYNPDLLELIEDKAIIPELASWPTEFAWSARRTIYGPEPRLRLSRPSTRRLVMAYLQDPNPSLKAVVDTIEETGTLNREDLVIVLIFKERELKREGRLFAKATFPARLFQAGTERAISNDILPYLPYQSMTLSEQQLTNRLAIYSDHLRPTATRKFVALVLDFSGWNLRFRHETMQPLYECFDDLYGFKNLFQYSQLLPMQSVILVKDEFRPPRMCRTSGLPLPCLTAWHGNESWFEGMRQKPWTIATMMIILGIARELKTHVSLTGQGDNQVILLNIPSDTELRYLGQTATQYAQSFLKKLAVRCQSAGIPLKPEETWISSRILEYARQYFVDGVQVPSTLKRMTRLHSLTNEDFPTIASDVSTVFSAGCSAANLATVPDAVYLTTIFEALEAIDFCWPTFFSERTIQELAVFVSLNRTVGGLPCSIYPDFVIRGLPDPLTNNLSLRHIIQLTDTNQSTQDALWRTRPLPSRHVNPTMLIKDPVSLPLLLPVQAENFIRRNLEDALKQCAKNEMVVRLISTEADLEEERLLQDLLTLSPLNPRVAHEFFLLSNVGLRIKLLGRFYKARSLAQASRSESATILSQITKHEADTLSYYRRRFLEPCPPILHDREMYIGFEPRLDQWCASDVAKQLRQKWWNLTIEGVTQAPPWEQGYMARYNKIPSRLLRATLLFNVLPLENQPPKMYGWTRGRLIPYLGSQTKEKYKKPALQTAEVGSLLTAVKRIVTVFDWLRDPEDPNMALLRDVLLGEKTDIGLAELQLVAPRVYGGCPTHRLHARAVSAGASLCGLMTFSTHVHFSSSGATIFARSVDNYTVMFQQLFLYATSVLALRAAANESVSGEWGYIILCPGCTEFIPELSARLLSSPTYSGIHCFSRITTLTLKTDLPSIGATANNPQLESASLIAYRAVSVMQSEDALQAYTYEHPEAISPGTLYPITDFVRTDFKALLANIVIYLTSLRSLLEIDVPALDTHTQQELLFLPEWTMDPKSLPLQTLARCIQCSGRVWELFQMCPALPRTHNSVLTARGISQLLLHAFRVLGKSKCQAAFRLCNLVPFDVPTVVFLRQWEMAIISLSTDPHQTLASLRRCKSVFFDYADTLGAPSDMLKSAVNHGFITDYESQVLLHFCPGKTRPEGLVIEDLRKMPCMMPAAELKCLYIPQRSTTQLAINIIVQNDPTPELAWIPEAPLSRDRPRLCHITRPVGNISTSISKILDILANVPEHELPTTGIALTLAEGAGSMLAGLLHLFPYLLGYYNSLLPDPDRGDDPCVYYPPALLADGCGCHIRLLGAAEMRAGDRDLTNPATVKKIVDTLSDLEFPVSYITMDAEVTTPETYGSILMSTLDIISQLANESTIIILKIFLTCQEVHILISTLSKTCSDIWLCKPPASDRDSSEFYIFASGFDETKWPLFLTTDRCANDALRRYHAARQHLRDISTQRYVNLLREDAQRLRQAIISCPCLDVRLHGLAYFSADPTEPDCLKALDQSRYTLERNLLTIRIGKTQISDSHALDRHLAHRSLTTHVSQLLHKFIEVKLALKILETRPAGLEALLIQLAKDNTHSIWHVHLTPPMKVCSIPNCARPAVVYTDKTIAEIYQKILRPTLHLYSTVDHSQHKFAARNQPVSRCVPQARI